MSKTAESAPTSDRRLPLVPELIARQAEQRGSDLAVVCDGFRLTYGELVRRADSIAARLHTLGAGPEQPVGLCVNRSADWIAGLLGILRAGAAYLPLDPVHPPQRLASIAGRARAGVVLVEDTTARLFQPAGDLRVVDCSVPAPQESTLDDLPPVRLVADNAAYVIYTSGSTGEPKAVVASHRSLSHFLRSLQDAYPVDRRDNVMQLASIGFDASVLEVFLGLTSGATLHIASDAVRTSPAGLRRWIQESGITVGSLPPVLADSFFETELGGLPLRLLLTGSDWVARFPPAPARFTFVNTYGPTEATVFVTIDVAADAHQARAAVGEPPGCGVPMAGTSVHLLDERLNPVAHSDTGEVYLAGAQLARGYLHEPGRTAERFVADPAGGGDRMFRTGDLARWRADGDLEFVGRVDTQVKVHGMRVELGEVEAVLRRHPRVLQAVVTAEGTPRPRSLAAHVSLTQDESRPEVSAAELREHAARLLPHYMCPARYERVGRWPLNASGKIDRAEVGRRTWEPLSPVAAVAPETVEEQAAAEVWGSVLGRDSVGRNDNFFALGGHSLLVGPVLAGIERRLNARLPIRDFFGYRDLAECAAATRSHQGSVGDRIGALPRPADGVPLSYPQRQVWFLHTVHPDSLAYHFSAVLRLDGRLNSAALEQSLRAMVARHEICRTAFRERTGVPYQVIEEEVPLPLQVVDLSGHHEPDAAAERHLAAQARTRFDLTRAPLVRWTLLKLGHDRHLLQQVEHHMVHDGWSFHLFLREMLAYYRGFHTATPPGLPPPVVQFADYALWQHRWVASQEAASQLAYWRRQLADCPPSPNLPTDRARPPVPSFAGDRVHLRLPPWLCRALRELGSQEGTTLYVVMLTAFLALLQRYSGESDLVVGSSAANRHRDGAEHLIGMLVNDLVLRVDLSGHPTVRAATRRVREVVVEAHANQDLPFEKLVSALRPDRDLSHNPFYQVSFNFQDAPRPTLRLPDLDIELEDSTGNGSAKFDLTIVVAPRFEQNTGAGKLGREDGLALFFEYATDLFDRSTVERMTRHYRSLLEATVATPDQVISRLPMEEQGPPPVPYAPTEPGWASGTRIPDRIAHWATATPDRVAVCCGDTRLTYGQLVDAAGRITTRLGALGVGPGDVVALAVHRSVDMLAAMLGILGSGAAYLPLDPMLPPGRLAFLESDGAARYTLTDPTTRQELWPDRPAEIDMELDELSGRKLLCLRPLATPSGPALAPDTAYLVYTSGSTGQPKGVAVSHENVRALFSSLARRPGMTSTDVMSALTTISFDIAAVELLLPLCVGAQVAVARGDETFDPARLAAFLDRHGVTTAFATPDVWQALVESGWRHPGIRGFCGGEQLSGKLAAQLLERCVRLWNMYGPTETTIMSLLREVTPADTAAATVGLGAPPAGTEVHVLDDYGSPTPVGVVGEVCVGGAGVTHGYVGQPGLTAQRYVADWRGTPGGRLYRTGDLARRRADGDVEFVGRRDAQVKVHGHRIELGEIESALARRPEVSEAVVVARSQAAGKTLVAYVRPVNDAEADPERLLAALRETLPPYMVPGQLEVVSQWPRTWNGKIDRSALPAPDPGPVVDRHEPPRTPAEVVVATVWTRVLGVPRVGVHDHFLRIGGHSLAAVQVAAQLRALDLTVSARAVLEHPTVAQLARELSERRPQELEQSLRALRAAEPVQEEEGANA